MSDYDNVDFQEVALLLHVVEGAAKVQNLQSLSSAALTRLREIDAECFGEAKAIVAAKTEEAQLAQAQQLQAAEEAKPEEIVIEPKTPSQPAPTVERKL